MSLLVFSDELRQQTTLITAPSLVLTINEETGANIDTLDELTATFKTVEGKLSADSTGRSNVSLKTLSKAPSFDVVLSPSSFTEVTSTKSYLVPFTAPDAEPKVKLITTGVILSNEMPIVLHSGAAFGELVSYYFINLFFYF